ncbi:hypothetical protein B0H16DRAFT_1757546, partial [Mycena metata]
PLTSYATNILGSWIKSWGDCWKSIHYGPVWPNFLMCSLIFLLKGSLKHPSGRSSFGKIYLSGSCSSRDCGRSDGHQMLRTTSRWFRTLFSVWNANADEAELFRDGKTLAMVFMALVNVWDHIAISSLSNNHALVLLERTTSAVFSAHNIDHRIHHPSHHLKETIMVRLAAALMRAGEQIRYEAENNRGLAKNLKNQSSEIGQLIKKVGTLLNQELQTSKNTVVGIEEDTLGYKLMEKDRWEVIRNSLMDELAPMQMEVSEELMSEDETGHISLQFGHG